ncbi:thioredoxin H4-2 isoform X2 [Aristolochia californica]|uniref:thioredoxin H4-2 isoform X2 n=1 Tax=Aristolochia californica TaxID=171875 RepID=UPI0035DD00D6
MQYVYRFVQFPNLMGNFCGQGTHNDEEEPGKIEFQGGNVHIITSREDWDAKTSEANQDGKIVLANFSASWCGPCRVMAPYFTDLSKKYPALCFLSIDVDELTEFSSSWDINATPTFFFLKDGEQVDKLVGANRTELEKKIQSNLAHQ